MIPLVLTVRFLAELCALVALGFWGFRVGQSTGDKLALGVCAPLLAALLWGLFVSPKRRVRLPEPARWAIELLVFGGAAAALWSAGEGSIGLGFLLVAIADGVLVRVLKA